MFLNFNLNCKHCQYLKYIEHGETIYIIIYFVFQIYKSSYGYFDYL